MSKKILITGASGFAGSHLLNHLVQQGNTQIVATYNSDKSLETLGELKDKAEFTKIDLKVESQVTDLIQKSKPDVVYHLAAFASAANSFSSPKETFVNNVSSEINLLEAVKNHNLPNTRILIVSSAEVYGDVKAEDLPIDEQTPFNPNNPYAVSKLAQDFLARQYFQSHKMDIIIVRPFNHIGPRQSPDFVVSAFAKKIVEIEKGKLEPVLPVGNLDARRDFTDVRDVVRAYSLLVEKGEAGQAYNIGSGKSHKISDVLDKLLALSSVKVSIEVDKSLLRPIDNLELVCNPDKLKNLTGWTPEIDLDTTLKDTLDYWRNII